MFKFENLAAYVIYCVYPKTPTICNAIFHKGFLKIRHLHILLKGQQIPGGTVYVKKGHEVQTILGCVRLL